MYVGGNHQVLGSDLIALRETILMPEVVLGVERSAALAAISATAWYPLELMRDTLDFVSKRLGDISVKRTGWSVYKRLHQQMYPRVPNSVEQLVYGVDAMYRARNRGRDIGGWAVQEFADGVAVLEKNTPLHCTMEEGMFEEALRTLNVSAFVTHPSCARNGDRACVFELRSMLHHDHWCAPPSKRVETSVDRMRVF